nr:recombination protein NinB [Enterobacter kobei]
MLRDQRIRQNLIDYINQQPLNAEFPLVVSFSDPDRTLPQNSLFHALCGDVSKQLQWAGKRRNLSEWKVLFVSGHAVATGKPGEVVPGIEGEFCAIRESTSKMGIKRMNSLIEYTQDGVTTFYCRKCGGYLSDTVPEAAWGPIDA